MGSNTEDKEQIASEFSAVKQLFNRIKECHFNGDESFSILSAGMSDDYPIAIEHGSTHIRIGSGIFNE
jgi:uncharacterized pyridoxal phosphate-containing UPF0001 family protein